MNRLLSLLLISFLLLPVSAYAGIGSSISIFSTAIFGATNGVSQGPLESIISSTVIDIVATNAQTQPNLTVIPVDGSSQTAYDLTLGATTSVESTDPTFTAGSPDYLDHDGGDFQALIGSNTAFFNNLHKTTGGSAATIGIAFRTPASFSSGNLWGTISNAGDQGVRFFWNTSGVLIFQQRNGGLNSWVPAAGSLSTSTNYYVLVGFDFTNSTTNVEFWINTITGVTDTDVTASTTTTDPVGDFAVGARTGTHDQFIGNTSRVYAFNSFNEVINDATAALAFADMETRLGLDFTP